MSGRCGPEAPRPAQSWCGLPVVGAVRVSGARRDALEVCLDPLPADAPAVIGCDVGPDDVREPADTPAAVVEHVLGQLLVAARELFPAWLPHGESVTDATTFDRRTVRRLAHDLAAHSVHYGPFLAALAESAVTDRPLEPGFAPHVRARGLTRVLGSAYHRDAVALLVDCPALDGRAASAVSAAASWLVDTAPVAVWLSGAGAAALDRFAAVAPRLPAHVDDLLPVRPVPTPPPRYPAVSGRPHPRSATERALEDRLSRCAWASGRRWNEVYQPRVLEVPMRVDLMWPDARCVVEIDGADHRNAWKYADDRRRDNALVCDGWAVLRFTNDEVAGDPARVLATIERLLTDRRKAGEHP